MLFDSVQKEEQFTLLQESYFQFHKELMEDLEIFREQRHDGLDAAVVSVTH